MSLTDNVMLIYLLIISPPQGLQYHSDICFKIIGMKPSLAYVPLGTAYAFDEEHVYFGAVIYPLSHTLLPKLCPFFCSFAPSNIFILFFPVHFMSFFMLVIFCTQLP